MTSTLEVTGLRVDFGERVGLRDVSFAVEAGDCLAVLGVSGSGKSSLLRTLAGLQAASAGRIVVKGRDVTTLPPERRSIVYLHQEPVLFPHRTVLENVAFPLLVRGVAPGEARASAHTWLTRLQVDELAARSTDAVSGGQRHRIALARALCAEPDVLLLDEPLASLDPAIRRDVREALLAARAASGAAMLLVTHDLDDALAIASHISTIDGSSLSAAKAPAELLRSPPSLETARLLGVYAEIHGTVSDDSSELFYWIGGAIPAAGVPSGATVACVRAHEVSVRPGAALSAPLLTVAERRDGAHESLLTVRTDSGETATVRVGSGVAVTPGDVIQLAITQARFFTPD